MTFYTGKLPDGSDIIESLGCFSSPCGKYWSNRPFTKEQKKQYKAEKRLQKTHWKVFDHLAKKQRTIMFEYILILQRKSTLPRYCRDYIVQKMENNPERV